ncbi:hypothetical protein WJX84_011857 [Apatococcus fuscideae]|uniref:Chromatin modification-related protein EAF6 n=1 Tax=Apatococcus fuscideae TaxID=2026836 RepID=A0AAW1SV95_9CHLO
MPPKTANPSKTGARQKASPDVSQGVQQTDQQRPEQLRSLEERKNQLSQDLLKVEGQIFDLESRYLDSCNAQGNALTGYEGLLAKPSTHSRKAPARPTDRLFSSSSVTGASK